MGYDAATLDKAGIADKPDVVRVWKKKPCETLGDELDAQETDMPA